MGLLDAVKDLIGNIFTDGVKVADNIAKKRLAICNRCPHLLKRTGNCKKCGCFVSVKVLYADQRCSLGKW